MVIWPYPWTSNCKHRLAIRYFMPHCVLCQWKELNFPTQNPLFNPRLLINEQLKELLRSSKPFEPSCSLSWSLEIKNHIFSWLSVSGQHCWQWQYTQQNKYSAIAKWLQQDIIRYLLLKWLSWLSVASTHWWEKMLNSIACFWLIWASVSITNLLDYLCPVNMLAIDQYPRCIGMWWIQWRSFFIVHDLQRFSQSSICTCLHFRPCNVLLSSTFLCYAICLIGPIPFQTDYERPPCASTQFYLQTV
jgi:hypothetical protein